MSGNGQNWRNYERETNRSNNGRNENDERRASGNRMSVVKHVDGKKSLYMLFLKRDGERRFLASQKVRFDQRQASHTAIMSGYYREFMDSDEYSQKRADYKAEVDRHNKDKKLVQKTKQERAGIIRSQRHRDPEMFQQERIRHLETERQRRNASTIALPLRITEIHVADDLESFCKEKKTSAEMNLRAFLATNQDFSGNPLLSDRYNLQLISIFPFKYSYKYKMDKLTCYPAEIAVTTFNMQRGIIRNESRFVTLDSEWAYNNEEEESSRNVYADMLGISQDGPSNGYYPFEVFEWLQQQLERDPDARIVCDQNQFNFVYYGIRGMALYTGHNAIRYFQERIASRLLGIQDYTSALLQIAPLDIPGPTKWTDEAINQQFLDFHLVPISDRDVYCEYHDRSRVPAKYYCVKAHNARLLHNFFRIINTNKLQGLIFSEPLHETCIVDDSDPDLPEAFGAMLVSRRDSEKYKAIARQKELSRTAQNLYFNQHEARASEEPLNDNDQSDEEELYSMQHHVEPPTSVANNNFMSSSGYDPSEPSWRARDVEDIFRQRPILETNEIEEIRQIVDLPSEQRSFVISLPSQGDWETPRLQRICAKQESELYIERSKKIGCKRYKTIGIDVI